MAVAVLVPLVLVTALTPRVLLLKSFLKSILLLSPALVQALLMPPCCPLRTESLLITLLNKPRPMLDTTTVIRFDRR